MASSRKAHLTIHRGPRRSIGGTYFIYGKGSCLHIPTYFIDMMEGGQNGSARKPSLIFFKRE